jgi:hypothetical protein
MKIALCFIISYNHQLNQEDVWRKWINQNKDLFNIYFHYKNYASISSEWIKKHAMRPNLIAKTSYYYVVPAYMSILNHAFQNIENKWFCLLTESCVPIVSPERFRRTFFENYQASILKCDHAYWNIDFHHRANLKMIKKEFHLCNDPWFILSRDHVNKSLYFLVKENRLYKTICEGGLANESIFAIILKSFNEINDTSKVINEVSTLTDWEHMSSPTSPYTFTSGSQEEVERIEKMMKKHTYGLFLRKVSSDFPKEVLNNIIYKTDINYYTNEYDHVQMNKKVINKLNRLCIYFVINIGIYIILYLYMLVNISTFVHILDNLQM